MRRHPGSIADAFRSAVPMVFSSSLILVIYVFVVVTGGCMFQFMRPVFLYFFQNLANF